MIIVLKPNPDEEQLNKLKSWLADINLGIYMSEGTQSTLMGLIGDTSSVDVDLIMALDIVEDVKRIQEPYKYASRKSHSLDTVISVGGAKIGGGNFMLIAGPCCVESREQVCSIAASVKESGANVLRGGAFKPRTSPYTFQGLRDGGILLMLEAKRESGLPIVSEIMDLSQLPLFENVDIIQVGARSMQNFELLKEIGKIKKPVLLKRGMANTIQELLMSAEHIMAGGNEEIILCERGIRTFETATRNTLDLSAIPVIKELSHLPVLVDPSHSTGIARYIHPMSLAAVAVGADGLIIEVHNNPSIAMCDGQQSITPAAFAKLSFEIAKLLSLLKELRQ